MTESLNIKITPYSTPLFKNCSKAITIPSHLFEIPKSYLLLPSSQFTNHTSTNNICRTQISEDHNCLIQLEGECLHRYLLTKKNQVTHPVMEEKQIWCLVEDVACAFHTLRKLGCSHKYTHFKEYCIRRVPDMNGQNFKLIYHQNMISQLQLAQSGTIPWHSLYLSPEELTLKFIPEKSIIFSFGLMLLNICANSDRNRTIYKKDKYEVSKSTIRYKLKTASQNYGYSKILIGLIRLCLDIQPKTRPDFEGLWYNIDQLSNRGKLRYWKLCEENYSANQDSESSGPDKVLHNEQQVRKSPVGSIRSQFQTLPKQLMEPASSQSSGDMRSSIQLTPIDKFRSQGQLMHESRSEKQEQQQQHDQKQSQKQQQQQQQSGFVTMRPRKQISNVPQLVTETKIQIQITNTPIVHDCSSDNVYDEQIHSTEHGRISTFTHHPNNNYKYLTHKLTIPSPQTQLKLLKLVDCLKPIPELVKSIGMQGIWIEGDVYYGNFLHGKRQGLALEVYADGGYYYGYFRKDLYDGEGLYLWNSAEYYFGTFKAGQKVRGRLQGPTKYQGQFRNNKRHGQGTCWYPTGEIYSGGWSNDQRHGQGFIIEADGPKFVGNWREGKRRGDGYLQTDIMRIAGFWNNERVEGETLIEYSNGDAFRGITNTELQKVEGDYISNRGEIFKGTFENNQPKKGKLTYFNGEHYVGELLNMKRSGYGQYHYKNGDVCSGLWEDNQILQIQDRRQSNLFGDE